MNREVCTYSTDYWLSDLNLVTDTVFVRIGKSARAKWVHGYTKPGGVLANEPCPLTYNENIINSFGEVSVEQVDRVKKS